MPELFAQVITDLAHQEVDRVFTYAIPAELTGKVVPGARVVIPLGRMKKVEGYVLSLTARLDFPRERLREVLSCDERPALTAEQLSLLPWFCETYHSMAIQALRLLLPAPLRGGAAEKQVAIVSLLIAGNELEQAFARLKPESKQYKILSLLSDAEELDKETLTETLGDVTSPLNTLKKAGYIEISRRRVLRSPYAVTGEEAPPPPLQPQQQEVLSALLPALQTGGRFLLHGVTGSGKTEVYLRLIEKALALGKSALVLVPEISLTPQMLSRFRSRFGSEVALLHSALSNGERYDEWCRVREGSARVVLGARSAVFAPLQNLGVVIIDECHEQTYRSDTAPYYHAVEVAKQRAGDSALLLGSATPTVTQYNQALQGEYTLLKLPLRANQKPMPEILLVDMSRELAAGNRSLFSRALYQALQETLAKGEQAILFLNRRGWSTVVTCRSCGKTVKCPHCDVSLTFHATGNTGHNKLRCHYCGHEEAYPKVCPACQSPHIKYLGAGTEKVQAAVEKLFPGVQVLRMDVDTTRGKEAHNRLYQAFRNKEAQVLVGTQMVAKGLDFPEVSLVGVVSVDAMLNLPDYRAKERTFSLITQVAGRAGRAGHAGKVVVQTYTPRHYAIVNAVKYRYEEFFKRELAARQALGFPPFTRYLRVLCAGAEQAQVTAAAAVLWDKLQNYLGLHPAYARQVLSAECGEAPANRLKGLYRQQLLIKLLEPVNAELEQAIYGICAGLRKKNVFISFEADPSSLL